MTHPAAADPVSDSPLQHSDPQASGAPIDPHGHPAPSGEPADDSIEQPDGFTLWAVLRRDPLRPFALDESGAARAVSELASAVEGVEVEGVSIRGFYDASGFKADADIMIWLHGPVAEQLQASLRSLRRTELLRDLLPSWNAMGVHRGAEFNKAHIPAFLRGIEPRDWLVVYPFVRSYEWYLLPDAERSRMLAEHGRKGAAYRSVLANTVAAFALGDYEWLLPMESDTLVDLVDMMRALRSADARRHVREEVPFYTGRRIPVTDIPEVLQ
jgi:chlorite dismutase